LQMIRLGHQALQGDISTGQLSRRVGDLIVIVRSHQVLARFHRCNVKRWGCGGSLTEGHRAQEREREEEAQRKHGLQHIRREINGQIEKQQQVLRLRCEQRTLSTPLRMTSLFSTSLSKCFRDETHPSECAKPGDQEAEKPYSAWKTTSKSNKLTVVKMMS